MRQFLPRTMSRDDRRRGFVLIVVMVLVISVAFAGFSFVETMTNEYRAVHINGDLLEAEQALASADVMLRQFIGLSREQRTAAGGWDNNPEQFQEQIIEATIEEESEETDPLKWRFTIVSPPQSEQMNVLDTSGVRFGLENESAKLNLGNLINLDRLQPQGGRLALMNLPGMTEVAADSIMDWIDADDLPREFGAESEFYRELPNPYWPRNSLPTTLDELLLVRGVQRALLFGPDQNHNFRVDEDERQAEQLLHQMALLEEDTQAAGKGWADFVTLHSAERNVDRFGKPRIDLNHDDLRQLHTDLSDVFPPETVEFMIRWRQFGPGPTEESSPAASTSADLSTPPQFLFRSVLDIVDAHTFAAATPVPVTVVSPVTLSSYEELASLLDHTTVHPEVVLRNRINVNLASQNVLRSIPALTDELIDQLLNRRETLDVEAMQTPAWLLTEQVLSLETFKAVLPFVTAGGDVFRAQVVAWRPIGGPYRRVEFLINGATDPVGRIRWKDLSAFGVGFPLSSLSTKGSKSSFVNDGLGP